MVEHFSSLQGLAWGGREIDRQVGLAAYLRDRIRERTGFQLVVEVCRKATCTLHLTDPHSRSNSTAMFVSGTSRHVCVELERVRERRDCTMWLQS